MTTATRAIKLARERLCLAALTYAHHSSGGTAPLEAGSLLEDPSEGVCSGRGGVGARAGECHVSCAVSFRCRGCKRSWEMTYEYDD